MPNYYGQYYPMQSNGYPTQMNVGATQPTQIQSGGFVSVRSENEVINYPVAPGNCVTFKIEGQPIVMEKSMGFSNLESPHIERYRLVKEDASVASSEPHTDDLDIKAITDSIDTFKTEIDAIWDEIEDLRNMKQKPVSRRKEKEDDE